MQILNPNNRFSATSNFVMASPSPDFLEYLRQLLYNIGGDELITLFFQTQITGTAANPSARYRRAERLGAL
jgi:hypothetical protein